MLYMLMQSTRLWYNCTVASYQTVRLCKKLTLSNAIRKLNKHLDLFVTSSVGAAGSIPGMTNLNTYFHMVVKMRSHVDGAIHRLDVKEPGEMHV